MYYKVTITKTSKAIGSKDDYRIFDTDVQTYKTKEKAIQWITEFYAGHKRVKMFCDTDNGDAQHTGWIYCFRNADYSHSSTESWTQQDWIELSEVTEKRITF